MAITLDLSINSQGAVEGARRFEDSVNRVRKAGRGAENAANDLGEEFGKTGKSAISAGTSITKLDKSIDALGRETVDTGQDVGSFVNNMRKAATGSDKLEKELKETRQEIEKTGRASDRAKSAMGGFGGAVDSASGPVVGFTRNIGILKAGIAGLAGGLAIREIAEFGFTIAKAGDDANLARARIQALGGDARQFEALRDSAISLGVGVESTVSTFQRFAIARDNIGLADDELQALTENVIKLGRVGGAGTQELNAGLLQLGQALASGRLQGDELRSVLENLPTVAKLLADELAGGSTGALRELAAEGQITADKVAAALIGATDQINAKFSALGDNLGTSTTRVQESFTSLLSQIDDSVGVSTFLVDGFNRASETFLRFRDELNNTEAGGIVERVQEIPQEIEAARAKVEELRAGLARFPGQEIDVVDKLQIDLAVESLLELQEEKKRLDKIALDEAKSAVDRLSKAYGDAQENVKNLQREQKALVDQSGLSGESAQSVSDLIGLTDAVEEAATLEKELAGAKSALEGLQSTRIDLFADDTPTGVIVADFEKAKQSLSEMEGGAARLNDILSNLPDSLRGFEESQEKQIALTKELRQARSELKAESQREEQATGAIDTLKEQLRLAGLTTEQRREQSLVTRALKQAGIELADLLPDEREEVKRLAKETVALATARREAGKAGKEVAAPRDAFKEELVRIQDEIGNLSKTDTEIELGAVVGRVQDVQQLDQSQVAQLKAAAEELARLKDLSDAASVSVSSFGGDVLQLVDYQETLRRAFNEGAISQQEYNTRLAESGDAILATTQNNNANVTALQRVKKEIGAVTAAQFGLNESLLNGAITQAEYIAGSEELNTKLAELKDQQVELGDGFESGIARGLKSLQKEIKTTADVTEEFIVGSFGQVNDAFSGVIKGTESVSDAFSNMTTNILNNLADILTQTLIIDPLINSFTGSLSGGGSSNFLADIGGAIIGGFFENGAAFTAGNDNLPRPLPFAKGGIVSKPTLFPMATGAGLMGEAGPEAIMPLKRLGNGDLGVQAQGMGGGAVIASPVSIVVNNNSSQAEASAEESFNSLTGERVIKIQVEDIVDKGLRSGRFDGVMRQRFGNNVATVRR